MNIADDFKKYFNQHQGKRDDFVFNKEVAATYYPDLLDTIRRSIKRGHTEGKLCPEFFWTISNPVPDSGIIEPLPNNLTKKEIMLFVEMLRKDGFEAKIPFFDKRPYCILWKLPKDKPKG